MTFSGSDSAGRPTHGESTPPPFHVQNYHMAHTKGSFSVSGPSDEMPHFQPADRGEERNQTRMACSGSMEIPIVPHASVNVLVLT